MTTTIALLTNHAYTSRRRKPELLICIHITGNANNLADGAAMAERNYANGHSGGPSAHDYIDRDGDVVHAIDTTYFAWSNGDLQSPNTGLALINTVKAWVAAGFNPNEPFVREVECVGYPGSAPLTAAQRETVAQLIAADSKQWGIPISRYTVGTHADLNSVTRSSCAFSPATREADLAGIIGRAQQIAGGTDVDATKEIPFVLGDVASGGTLYSDLACTKALINPWAGGAGVGLYDHGVRPDGKTMVRVRIDMGTGGSGLTADAWIGMDKVSNVRLASGGASSAELLAEYNKGVAAAAALAATAKK